MSNTIAAQHVNKGETIEFDLEMVSLKRQSAGEDRQFPFFPEEMEAADLAEHIGNIFGQEFVQDMIIEGARRLFQMIYFVKSPTGETPSLDSEGKPRFTVNKKGKSIPITIKSETPVLARFLEFIKEENLSTREITLEYCMRRGLAIKTGSDPKWKDRSEKERTEEAFKWMQRANEIMMKSMGTATKE